MVFELKTVRRIINKAFLKEPIERSSFTVFKDALEQFLNDVEIAKKKNEHEEHFKNFLAPFFNKVGFHDYSINTSGRIDMAIHTGGKGKDPVGVLIEAKRPGNSNEMITKNQINRKAMHEAVLYYLEQRIEQDNSDLKHVIITNMDEWFIFDAQEFERFFYRPSRLRKIWKEWKSDRKVSSNNDFMYTEISKYIDSQDAAISGLWLPMDKTKKYLKGEKDSKYEKKLIPIYKLFTPTQLLKEPFANDSNSLNKEFYKELLYILGLEETKDGSTRYIQRAPEESRNQGAIIENTIRILDVEDHLSTLKNSRSSYGKNREEQLFSVAMELSITWMNRVLFLKLLEAQLYRYHRQDKNFKFLNFQTIDGLDELNKLFFQVLARKEKDRSEDINEKFGHIPYLNSSLFDVSSLERQTTRISGLDDHAEMPVYGKSVLNKQRGETLNTLDYLFQFLEAYDFSAEGSEEIRDESKSLINASVLGLIFEKINGYKDGSFYTPGFITEYMAQETLQKAVTDAFNTKYGWNSNSFDDLYNEIHRERVPLNEANEVINDLKICDPAVGSGHFLVSCLNELIAIKSRLDILCDNDGKLMRQIDVIVENDELIISWGEEELFEYDVSHSWKGTTLSSRSVSSDLERVQKAMFKEKRYLIENCLFGVDINPNSVKICRLRLWIELLKRAYYTPESNYMELEVLPNIDINIKQGNSLVSRFELDSDLSSVFKDSEHSLEDYKEAVRIYKHTGDRSEKQRLQQLIDDIKKEYTTTLTNNRPINQKISKARGKLQVMQSDDLFGEVKFTKKEIKKQGRKLKKLEKQKADEESGAFYNEAFEWRFEFPEVLNEEGKFTGFDVVIGNPPYIRVQKLDHQLIDWFKEVKETAHRRVDISLFFFELGKEIVREEGVITFISSNQFINAEYGRKLREFIASHLSFYKMIDLGDLPIFEEALTYVSVFILKKNKMTDFYFAKIDDMDSAEQIGETEFIKIDCDSIRGDDWLLKTSEEISIFKKIEEFPSLSDQIGKCHYGIISGNDSIFNIDAEVIEKFKIEDEITLPLIRASNCSRYGYVKTEMRIIYPYDVNGDLISEPVLKSNYPNAYKYLLNNKEKLAKRKDSRKTLDKLEGWFKLTRHGSVEVFNSEKIIYPGETKQNKFGIDKSSAAYSGARVFGIIVNDLQNMNYLLGCLNSSLLEYYLHSISPLKQGGYYSYSSTIIDNLPVPSPDTKEAISINKTVGKILSIKKQNSDADTTNLERVIDRLVYELYGLSEEEVRVVKRSVA